MSYQYSKELDKLKTQAIGNSVFPLFLRTTLFSFLFYVIIYAFTSDINHTTENNKENVPVNWVSTVESDVVNRVNWLSIFPLGSSVGRAYFAFAESVTTYFITRENFETKDTEFGLLKPRTWSMFFARYTTSFILLLSFAILVAFPVWSLGILLGIVYAKRKRRSIYNSINLLTVCDRKESPFYSGIYGPWRPNLGSSGTDFSAPGVAIPPKVDTEVSKTHSLYKTLEDIANSPEVLELFTDLLGVILACKDYPAFIPPETPSDDDVVRISGIQNTQCLTESKDGISAIAALTVEDSATQSTKAFVRIYSMIQKFADLSKEETCNTTTNETSLSLKKYEEFLSKYKNEISEFEFAIISSLTPKRAVELLSIPRHVCISSLLALEAGKSLVFQKSGNSLIKISRFPHLQARAVIQAFASYHKAYSGQIRQIIRLAILGSRRNGDYGHPLLPLSCVDSIRALRQLLELSQSSNQQVNSNSILIRFEAHIEEMHEIFKANFYAFFKERIQLNEKTVENQKPALMGFPYKNIVIFPLSKLVDFVFLSLSEYDINYLTHLITEITDKELFPRVTSRLPGLSQQMNSLRLKVWPEDVSSNFIYNHPGGADLVLRWKILRHVLIRYGWISTRVGDEPVPQDSIIQAVVYKTFIQEDEDPVRKPELPLNVMDAMVPIRKRRFEEMFGANWMSHIYSNAIQENLVKVFTKYADITPLIKSTEVMNG